MSRLSLAPGGLLRDGEPHRIVSGSIHYFRVHPDQWGDRLDRLAAMGANTLDTYIAWNFHEERQGRPDFTGWRDLPRFVELAGERGLDVILRPGPYICAEWDNGGLPSWLTGRAGLELRTSDPGYTSAVEEWFSVLMPRLAGLQASQGGPVLAWQIENEYGSYADDQEFMQWNREALLRHGATELLYTADGPTHLMQDGGALDGTLATATFGSRPQASFALLEARRPGTPLLCAEYWNGWFDHWGEKHHVRTPESVAADVDAMLEANGSVSLYMAHGGTNFGLWAGANHDGALQPTITSYDSDAPIAEDGTLTPKWHDLREVITRRLGSTPPPAPADPRLLSPALGFAWETSAPLRLPSPRQGSGQRVHPAPPSFEALGLSSGLVVYSAQPVLPLGPSTLVLEGLRDRATVLLDGEPLAALDAESALTGIDLHGDGERHRLEVVVEAYGHINYGQLLGEPKGLLGPARIDRRRITGWRACAIDLAHAEPAGLAELTRRAPIEGTTALGGLLATARVSLDEALDGHLALPGWGRGYVWINNTLLGRYDEVGPQRSLYVPSPLLHAGDNTVTLLEMRRLGGLPRWLAAADLGESEQFIEVFD
ncbi:MAG: beta-galactosidase [Arthrobacter sp.]|nr:beta-galactosidase [Arthrobacter sp.]